VADSAYIRAFKELTKAKPGMPDARTTEEEFYGESDRASAILLGSMVESALEVALKSVLRPDMPSDLSQRLFEGDGVMSTFSAKINLGFAFAILGTKAKHDLDLIKLLRNSFAHCRIPLTFETPEVIAVCEHLQIPDTTSKIDISVHERTPTMIRTGTPEKGSTKWPRFRFATSCHSLAYWLLIFSNRYTSHRCSHLGYRNCTRCFFHLPRSISRLPFARFVLIPKPTGLNPSRDHFGCDSDLSFGVPATSFGTTAE
jgi:hypothetical protein